MQYKALTLVAALATGVSAQSAIPSDVSASVIQVLITALPPSALSLAATNPPAFQSEIVSSLSAGNTPEWYNALPSDVKSILPQMYPVSTPAETTASETPTATETSTVAETTVAGSISGKPTGGSNSTTTVNSPTLSSSTDGGPTTSIPGNGASFPTAVIGSGLAGALGVIGMLAL